MADPARPALWRVADADTTIYLFGSIHMLPPGASWRSDAVDQALKASDTVWFEADVAGDPGAMAQLVERLGRLPGSEKLSDRLSPDQASAFGAAAARLGLSRRALDTMQPWYAAIVMSDAAIRSAGYGSDGGVDAQLRKDAEAAGKRLQYLETVEMQLSALADLPADVQLEYLELTVAEVDDVTGPLAEMTNAWRKGDVATLARVLIEDDMARLPALQHALLTRRNANWAAQIDQLLDQETGMVFMAVGVAHLVGDASVLTELSARGRSAKRIQ